MPYLGGVEFIDLREELLGDFSVDRHRRVEVDVVSFAEDALLEMQCLTPIVAETAGVYVDIMRCEFYF